MEYSIPPEESGSILSIPGRHLARRGSWIATVTEHPLDIPSLPPQGSRKVGLLLAGRIDPTFSADRIFFSPELLLAALEQSRPGEVYYLEDAILNVAGLLQFTREPGNPIRDLIVAVRRHGVGLILVSKVPDNHLTYLIRNARNTAIILRDLANKEPLLGDVLEPSTEPLAFVWYECRAEVLYGRRGAVMRIPVINGQRVAGILAPQPPEDLLQRCQSQAEENRVARYQEALEDAGGGL